MSCVTTQACTRLQSEGTMLCVVWGVSVSVIRPHRWLRWTLSTGQPANCGRSVVVCVWQHLRGGRSRVHLLPSCSANGVFLSVSRLKLNAVPVSQLQLPADRLLSGARVTCMYKGWSVLSHSLCLRPVQRPLHVNSRCTPDVAHSVRFLLWQLCSYTHE